MRVILILGLLSSAVLAVPKHVVVPSGPYGFFSLFLQVVNHLVWADKQKRPLVVYWGTKDCLLNQPGGYKGCHNPWE